MGRGTWPSPRCAHDPWADSRRSGQETQGAPHLRGGRAGSGGGSSAWAASQVSSSQQCLLRTGDNISHAGDISIFYKCITSITSMVWRIDVASICMHVLLHMHTRRAALPEQRMPRSSPRRRRCQRGRGARGAWTPRGGRASKGPFACRRGFLLLPGCVGGMLWERNPGSTSTSSAHGDSPGLFPSCGLGWSRGLSAPRNWPDEGERGCQRAVLTRATSRGHGQTGRGRWGLGWTAA